MPSEVELTRFIGSSFRSVWALEVLCELRNVTDLESSPDHLVRVLRASEVIVSQSLADLVAVGLVQISALGEAKYAPATEELEQLASAVVARYASAPNSVRRTIVNARSSDLNAFANAFRLRSEQ
jgi:hypothetical protein